MILALTPVINRNDILMGIWLRGVSSEDEGILPKISALTESNHGLAPFVEISSPEALTVLKPLASNKIRLVIDNALPALAGQATMSGFSTALSPSQFVTSVASVEVFNQALADNAQWFTGVYLSHPPIKPGTSLDSSRVAILQLLSLVAQDADSSELEQVLKHEPSLSYHLLRLVNSVAMGLRKRITSISQALMLLGRRQLERWLQLLMYAENSETGAPNKLMLLAAWRGRLMELLAAKGGWDQDRQDQAFIVGIFSLLDCVLGMSFDEIVKNVPVSEDVRMALLTHAAELGGMLALVEDWQSGGAFVVPNTLASLSEDDLFGCQVQSLQWALNIDTEVS